MSGGLIFVLIVVFLIGSALDRLRKMGTGAPPGGSGRGVPPVRVSMRVQRTDATAAGGEAAGEQSAETLLKEDLWALLTGLGQEAARQTGQRRLPSPAPAPAPQQRSSFELPAREPARPARAEPAVDEGQHLEAAPAAVATPAPAAPAPAMVRPARRAPGSGLHLGGVADLRRAMALRTILGPPKSLE